ncbi:MAG: hypothetical protein WAN51_06575, partial [Alphaproteobacteria bacterium]
MRKDDRARQLPEITRYTKYYEHDGMLRAYANRSMLLAMIFGLLAMVSLGFAVYVRVLPPTVIRVDKDGNAFAVMGPGSGRAAALNLSAAASSSDSPPGVGPTDLEGRAVVRQFLTR